MTLTIEISPELEMQLRQEADKAGLGADKYVLNTLEEHLRHRRRQRAPRLSAEETRLLSNINDLGISPDEWQHYNSLKQKRRARTLTDEEQAELVRFAERVEDANARRLERLLELARVRHTTLPVLMEELGLFSKKLYE